MWECCTHLCGSHKKQYRFLDDAYPRQKETDLHFTPVLQCVIYTCILWLEFWDQEESFKKNSFQSLCDLYVCSQYCKQFKNDPKLLVECDNLYENQ